MSQDTPRPALPPEPDDFNDQAQLDDYEARLKAHFYPSTANLEIKELKEALVSAAGHIFRLARSNDDYIAARHYENLTL